MRNTGIPMNRINLVMRSQKQTYASPASILIDDYEKNAKEFTARGGTGITFKSAKILSKIKGIEEFNIGHFIIGESIFIGIKNCIKKFKKIIK